MRQWPERALTAAAPAIRRHHVVVLGVALALAAAGASLAMQLRVSGDITALVPESSPSVQALRQVERLYGSPNTLIVFIRSGEGEEAREVLAEVADALSAHPLVARVDERFDVAFFRERALYFLSLDQLERLASTLEELTAPLRAPAEPGDEAVEQARRQLTRQLVRLRRALEREEGDLQEYAHVRASAVDASLAPGSRNDVVYALTVHPRASSANVEETDRFVAEVTRTLDAMNVQGSRPGTRLVLGGATMGQTYQSETLLSDVKRVSIFGAMAVALWILVVFRRPMALVLVTLPLLVALSWIFGIARLTVGQLNVITASTFVILFGIGIDFGIHIFSRYRELRLQGLPFGSSLDRAVVQTGRATGTAATTTALAFSALALGTYRGFSELGLIIATGVALSFLAALILFPAAASAAHRVGLLKLGTGRPVVDDVMRGRARAPRGHAAALALGLAATVAAAVGASRLEFQWDCTDLAYRPAELDEAEEYQRAIFGTHLLPAVVATETPEQLRSVVAELRRRAVERGERSTIDRVLSLDDLVPEDQEAKRPLLAAIGRVADERVAAALDEAGARDLEELRRLASAGPYGVEDLPASVRQRFQGRSNGSFAVVYPSVELADLASALRFRDEIANVVVEGRAYSAANPAIVMAEMVTLMFSDARWVFALALAVVVLLVLIDLRRIGDTLLVLTPLMLGLLWMLGTMAALGMRIDFYNLVALPAVIGLGVDNGVFLMHRYREEGPGSLRRVVRHTGSTIGVTTGATVLGMASLMLGRHPGLVSIGAASAIGLVATFLAAVLVLPSLLYVVERVRAAMLVRHRGSPVLFTVKYDPWTRLLRQRLEGRDVRLVVVDLDVLPPPERLHALERVRDLSGSYDVPVLVVGDRWIREAEPEWSGRLEAMLDEDGSHDRRAS